MEFKINKKIKSSKSCQNQHTARVGHNNCHLDRLEQYIANLLSFEKLNQK